MRLIYFAPVTLQSYWQRPHYFVRYFLQNGIKEVLWINPYPNRLPRWGDLRLLKKSNRTLNQSIANVIEIQPKALPIEPIIGGTWINKHLLWQNTLHFIEEYAQQGKYILGIGRPSRLALFVLDKLQLYGKSQKIFFDAMDDFPEFHTGLSYFSMSRNEKLITQRANVVFASSETLVRKLKRYNVHVVKVLNGYDMSQLPIIEQRKVPKVIGFVGSIARWFDWKLVIELANACPDWTVRLIGPCFDVIPNQLPKNIELLPECTQREAVHYLKNFGIGLIPFKQNNLTKSVDPIKYYEYRGMGLPVISTSFGEMINRRLEPYVYLVEGSTDWPSLIKQAFKERPSMKEIEHFRMLHDWNNKFDQIGQFWNE